MLKLYPDATDPSHNAFLPGFRTGRVITNVFRNLLVSGLLHGFLRSRSLVVKALLPLFGTNGGMGGGTVQCKSAGAG